MTLLLPLSIAALLTEAFQINNFSSRRINYFIDSTARNQLKIKTKPTRLRTWVSPSTQEPSIHFLSENDDDDDDDDDKNDEEYEIDQQRGIEILFEDDDDIDEKSSDDMSSKIIPKKKPKKLSRWDKLDPKIKAKIIEKGQQRAIANKKKREPIQDKKRRLLMFVKEQQIKKKKAARVNRPLAFDKRAPLSEIIPGTEINGIIISLTKFGAYVDIGTECDGLLHVSQISNSTFIEHPRQILSPGEEVTVRVRSLNADRKKLHLTMLPPEVLAAEEKDKKDATERIQLNEMMVDDELWGELRRVTDYGAYVEVGAVVDGWLHFMDHPLWDYGLHPSEFMKTGDRVRVWVADIDMDRERIKLTANRPAQLPGPRREFN